MVHFSQEFLEKLIAEHKLVSTTIAHLSTSGPRYCQRHDNQTVAQAIQNLKVRKVELEGQMDVLGDFLNG